MAIAFQCDRCGSITYNKQSIKKARKTRLVANGLFCYREYELCDNCWEDFVKFIKHYEKKDGINE